MSAPPPPTPPPRPVPPHKDPRRTLIKLHVTVLEVLDLCGHPEWANDERFATNAARVGNRAEMVKLVGDCIRQKTAAEWFQKLDAAGIPAGPINTISEALADLQAQHRQMTRTMAGIPVIGSPLRLDGERADSDLPPPALGEHTADVLAAAEISSAEIERLRQSGVIG